MAKAATAKKQLPEGLETIERLAATFSARRATLVEELSELDAELRQIKRSRIGAIRRYVAAVKDAQAELKAAIEANEPEFEKPRTRTFHGVKVGFRKLVGKIGWADADQVITLIKKHFPDRADLLIRTTESPVKDAIAQLQVTELKKIGCNVGEDSDEVVISASDSDVDKIVDALLKDTPEPAEEQQQRKAS